MASSSAARTPWRSSSRMAAIVVPAGDVTASRRSTGWSAYGAALMLRESTDHPVLLREAVTSPAGTTIAAIRELERHGVRAALIYAIEAARDRSVELGRAAQQS